MFGKRFLGCMVALILAVTSTVTAFAAAPEVNADKGTIIFVPHDNRPISDEQTADTVRRLGYNVLVPPDDMLGGREKLGDADAIWKWLEDTAKQQSKGDKTNSDSRLKAIVISSDTMIYGSLVASRKHVESKHKLMNRADKFVKLHEKYPDIKLYAFSSIMRTPRSGEYSGNEEPEYYKSYGADIFKYTALLDKQELKGLNSTESKMLKELTQRIPKDALKDWMSRRTKNYAVNERLIDLTKKGVFSYFVMGRDDNAPFSQTHKESRHLNQYGKELFPTRFQAMAGIDEYGMLLLTRAVNEITKTIPFVYVRYNYGRGGNTIPSYSDEKISDSIKSHIICAGAMQVNSPRRADLVLLVNTNPSGKTGEANDLDNTEKPRQSTTYFVNMVNTAYSAGQPVGIADIAYANGSDNALMAGLRDYGLLFKIRAYSGWNTATNSTGFVLGQGILAAKMSDSDRDELLLTRYLDDWAYQANIRQIMARQLGWFRMGNYYASLNERKEGIEARSSRLMQLFAETNLPPFNDAIHFHVTYPWNRMFEARVTHTK